MKEAGTSRGGQAFHRRRWRSRLGFFLTGAGIALTCAAARIWWMELVPYPAYTLQPDWLKLLKGLVAWLPWIACAVVIVLRIARGPQYRMASFALGTLVPHAALIGWMLFGSVVANWRHAQDFDPALWKNPESVEHDPLWPPRLCMVDDLLDRRGLDPMTEAEVVELLGPADETAYFSGWDLVYRLGPERGFIRIDSEWLVIRLDPHGNVREYRLVTD